MYFFSNYRISTFGASSFAFALLLSICLCQDNAISLRDFTCAKKDVPLHDGLFTSDGADRLKIDSAYFTNGNGNATTIDLLRMNAKDDQPLVISVIVTEGGDADCFNRIYEMPPGCLVGLESETPQHQECNNENKDHCSVVEVKCKFSVVPVDNLPDARFIHMPLWVKKNSTDANDTCDWIAYIDNVHVLMNKSTIAYELDGGQCWKVNRKWLIVVVACCSLLAVACVVLIVFAVFLCRQNKRRSIRRKRRKAQEAEKKKWSSWRDDLEKSASLSSTRAAEHGVEVPDSLCSDNEDEEEDKKTSQTPSVADNETSTKATSVRAQPAQADSSVTLTKGAQPVPPASVTIEKGTTSTLAQPKPSASVTIEKEMTSTHAPPKPPASVTIEKGTTSTLAQPKPSASVTVEKGTTSVRPQPKPSASVTVEKGATSTHDENS